MSEQFNRRDLAAMIGRDYAPDADKQANVNAGGPPSKGTSKDGRLKENKLAPAKKPKK